MRCLLLIAVYICKAVWLNFALSISEPDGYVKLAFALLPLLLFQGAVLHLVFRGKRRFDLKRLVCASALLLLRTLIPVAAFWLPMPTAILNLFTCLLLAPISVAVVFLLTGLSYFVLTGDGLCVLRKTESHPAAFFVAALAGSLAVMFDIPWFLSIAAKIAADGSLIFVCVLLIIIINFLLEAVLMLTLASAHLSAGSQKT